MGAKPLMTKTMNVPQKPNALIESIRRKLDKALRNLRTLGSALNGDNLIPVPVRNIEGTNRVSRRISI